MAHGYINVFINVASKYFSIGNFAREFKNQIIIVGNFILLSINNSNMGRLIKEMLLYYFKVILFIWKNPIKSVGLGVLFFSIDHLTHFWNIKKLITAFLNLILHLSL